MEPPNSTPPTRMNGCAASGAVSSDVPNRSTRMKNELATCVMAQDQANATTVRLFHPDLSFLALVLRRDELNRNQRRSPRQSYHGQPDFHVGPAGKARVAVRARDCVLRNNEFRFRRCRWPHD